MKRRRRQNHIGGEMLDTVGDFSLGKIGVATTQNSGHTPEFWAQQTADKICSISDSAPEHVRQQAHAFKNAIYHIILLNVRNAIKSDRTTLSNLMKNQGHDDIAKIISEI